MSTTITDQIASDGFCSHSTGPRPKMSRNPFSGPLSWKIMKKMNPDTADRAAAHGDCDSGGYGRPA